ncbi:MAG: hypothetical protein NTU88_08000, partial [Armatimonadetes bacterium]|nr:hypothetical protein [Armatimonadota bacterium]
GARTFLPPPREASADDHLTYSTTIIPRPAHRSRTSAERAERENGRVGEWGNGSSGSAIDH